MPSSLRIALIVAAGLIVAPAAAKADPVQGERVFQRCMTCHSVAPANPQLPGPNLRTVFGRKAGTLPGFEYSSAMVDAGADEGVVWTRETLEKFLADPDDFVPGTAMQPSFRLSADERRDVIDYLEQVGKTP